MFDLYIGLAMSRDKYSRETQHQTEYIFTMVKPFTDPQLLKVVEIAITAETETEMVEVHLIFVVETNVERGQKMSTFTDKMLSEVLEIEAAYTSGH